MMNDLRGPFLAVSLLAVAGCGGNGGGGARASDLSGVWQYSSGPSLLESGGQGQGFGGGGDIVDAQLDFLELNADGTGRGYASGTGAQLGCGNLLFAAIDETVVRIDFPDGFINRTFRYTLDEAGLTLIDENGAATVFTAAAAVPAASQCGTAALVTRVELVRGAGANTSMVTDGTNLYFHDGISLASIAIATLTANAPITTIGAYDKPITMEGADFWGDCNCGGSTDMRRFTQAGVMVDGLDTQNDLAHDLGIDGAAFDGTKMWILGYGYVAGRTELLRVDTAAEPDVLEAVIPLAYRPQTLSLSGGTFWSINELLGPALVSIDPATGNMTRAVDLPSHYYYEALVVLGQDAYLLGEDDATPYAKVLLHVTIPT